MAQFVQIFHLPLTPLIIMLILSLIFSLSTDPCNQAPVNQLVEAITLGLGQIEEADEKKLETVSELLESINAYFEEGDTLNRKNVVTNNSTGKPKLKDGKLQYEVMKGVTSIKKQDTTFFIDSQLQIDADGSTDSKEIDPDHGQVETSLKWLDEEGNRHSVNTHTVPFFVLPYNWYLDKGIKPGDVAAIIYKDRIEYAIFADVGPWQKMGEGSIALHNNLGNNPWTKSGKPWNGIESSPGVKMVVFPGSRSEIFETKGTYLVNGEPDIEKIREVGQKHLEELLSTKIGISPKTGL